MIEIHQKLKVSLIIPAFNEENNIKRVIKAAKKVEEVDEIIVVDDGSQDKTAKIAKKAKAKVVSSKKNQGKGYAMKKGKEKAKGDILIFLDADLKNISPKKIKKIIKPFRKNYDFVKTWFDRRGGRVTHLTATPLLEQFFPEIKEKFRQPLSGQIGIKKDLLKRLNLEDDVGVDIGILIDIMELSAKTKEVYYGYLIHEPRKLKDLKDMAKAVSRVILDKAARYNRLDNVIEKSRNEY